MNYTDTNFDITNIEHFNSVDGLIEISNYLDFALSTTIHKQLPNISREQEKWYAAEKLKLLSIDGIEKNFSRDFNIRTNISKIGRDKIKFLICKYLIERQAYNERVAHMMIPTEFIDQAAQYLTEQVRIGNFDQIQDWINQYMGNFIDSYISSQYNSDMKEQFSAMALENPNCAKALTQLNLEMSLNQIKQK